ncbi:D-glycero-D-manno-heptose 1,7-bisphosphate phosphatase [Clostridium sp. USBA 49]|jgi:D-glycero-D-manno-heptose 1,7-bisphosphate phosphatase|uniref:D-glycero-alpha-D-manno-heptose-1,7-bisphosphate 7-phosphatase n=1 Tax=Clostridium sp. USBA 49 TaxID=1881060 RepID=UPI00099A51DE|nr:HAD family hydrolase [Clostridium sp. USBA 49]SKA83841.1 D-glycero-D-manno-heptose 1,7-bisphosphate phosphatase [Clostridium sp. USBA 49]
MNKALFLDRDGVINDNSKKHVNKPDDLIIYDGVKEALKKAYDGGYDLFIVTNQGGIEMGHLTKEQLEDIHKKMIEELKPYCSFKEIKYCPDFNKKSNCRKPNPGMILELSKKYSVDLKNSWMIGDMDTDIEAGISAGCKTAKIGTINENADINGKNLYEVVNKIMELQ